MTSAIAAAAFAAHQNAAGVGGGLSRVGDYTSVYSQNSAATRQSYPHSHYAKGIKHTPSSARYDVRPPSQVKSRSRRFVPDESFPRSRAVVSYQRPLVRSHSVSQPSSLVDRYRQSTQNVLLSGRVPQDPFSLLQCYPPSSSDSMNNNESDKGMPVGNHLMMKSDGLEIKAPQYGNSFYRPSERLLSSYQTQSGLTPPSASATITHPILTHSSSSGPSMASSATLHTTSPVESNHSHLSCIPSACFIHTPSTVRAVGGVRWNIARDGFCLFEAFAHSYAQATGSQRMDAEEVRIATVKALSQKGDIASFLATEEDDDTEYETKRSGGRTSDRLLAASELLSSISLSRRQETDPEVTKKENEKRNAAKINRLLETLHQRDGYMSQAGDLAVVGLTLAFPVILYIHSYPSEQVQVIQTNDTGTEMVDGAMEDEHQSRRKSSTNKRGSPSDEYSVEQQNEPKLVVVHLVRDGEHYDSVMSVSAEMIHSFELKYLVDRHCCPEWQYHSKHSTKPVITSIVKEYSFVVPGVSQYENGRRSSVSESTARSYSISRPASSPTLSAVTEDARSSVNVHEEKLKGDWESSYRHTIHSTPSFAFTPTASSSFAANYFKKQRERAMSERFEEQRKTEKDSELARSSSSYFSQNYADSHNSAPKNRNLGLEGMGEYRFSGASEGHLSSSFSMPERKRRETVGGYEATKSAQSLPSACVIFANSERIPTKGQDNAISSRPFAVPPPPPRRSSCRDEISNSEKTHFTRTPHTIPAPPSARPSVSEDLSKKESGLDSPPRKEQEKSEDEKPQNDDAGILERVSKELRGNPALIRRFQESCRRYGKGSLTAQPTASPRSSYSPTVSSVSSPSSDVSASAAPFLPGVELARDFLKELREIFHDGRLRTEGRDNAKEDREKFIDWLIPRLLKLINSEEKRMRLASAYASSRDISRLIYEKELDTEQKALLYYLMEDFCISVSKSTVRESNNGGVERNGDANNAAGKKDFAVLKSLTRDFGKGKVDVAQLHRNLKSLYGSKAALWLMRHLAGLASERKQALVLLEYARLHEQMASSITSSASSLLSFQQKQQSALPARHHAVFK